MFVVEEKKWKTLTCWFSAFCSFHVIWMYIFSETCCLPYWSPLAGCCLLDLGYFLDRKVPVVPALYYCRAHFPIHHWRRSRGNFCYSSPPRISRLSLIYPILLVCLKRVVIDDGGTLLVSYDVFFVAFPINVFFQSQRVYKYTNLHLELSICHRFAGLEWTVSRRKSAGILEFGSLIKVPSQGQRHCHTM